MSISVKSMRCPDCNATLNIEEGRKQCFCSYCGARILIVNNNEFEYTNRIVDEAAIEKARTDKEVQIAKYKNDTAEIIGALIMVALMFIVMIVVLGME